MTLSHRRLARVVAIVLVLIAAVSFPLAGCKKAEPQPAEGAGETGGSPDGMTGVEVGQDPSTGDELGEWGDWDFDPAPGQRHKYTINMVSHGELEPPQPGWYEVTFSDAGGGKLKVAYVGNCFGRDFSGEYLTVPHGWDLHQVGDSAVDDIVLRLTGPALQLTASSRSGGRRTWTAGENWSYVNQLGDKLTFTITGKRAFAGITGAYGEYTETVGNDTLLTEFCVNPNVPLPLYVKDVLTTGTEDRYVLFESVLTEYSGHGSDKVASEKPTSPSSSSSSPEPVDFNGVWVQKDDNGVQGYFAWLLRDGFAYLGLKGSSADDIYDDVCGLRGASGDDKKGIPFRVESSAIVLSMPDGAEMEWRREGTTFWIGAGEIRKENTSGAQGPNLVTVSVDGEYVPQ